MEGKGYGGEKKIRIEPRDEKLGNMKDKEYILVMYRDDLYYLIEANISKQESPVILVVPKDEIKYAMLYRRPSISVWSQSR